MIVKTLPDGKNGVFVMDDKYTPETVSIMRLANYMADGSTFEVVDNYSYQDVSGKVIVASLTGDDETMFVENLIASYFFENCEVPPIALLDSTVIKPFLNNISEENTKIE